MDPSGSKLHDVCLRVTCSSFMMEAWRTIVRYGLKQYFTMMDGTGL